MFRLKKKKIYIILVIVVSSIDDIKIWSGLLIKGMR